MSDVCWGPVETQFGTFGVWVDARGRLTKLWLDLKRALKSELALPRDDRAVRHVVREIQEYAGGKRKAFTLDLAPEGTPFQLSVWNALLKVPYGETTSYGALANRLGFPNSARAVGHANGSNPHRANHSLPSCHRRERQSHGLWWRSAYEESASGIRSGARGEAGRSFWTCRHAAISVSRLSPGASDTARANQWTASASNPSAASNDA